MKGTAHENNTGTSWKDNAGNSRNAGTSRKSLFLSLLHKSCLFTFRTRFLFLKNAFVIFGKKFQKMKRPWRKTTLKLQENGGKLKGPWRENDRNMKRNTGQWQTQEIQGNRSFFPSVETVWYCMASALLWRAFSDAGFVYIIHIAMAPYSDICMVIQNSL